MLLLFSFIFLGSVLYTFILFILWLIDKINKKPTKRGIKFLVGLVIIFVSFLGMGFSSDDSSADSSEKIAKIESTKKAESIAKAESTKKAESIAKAESTKKAESIAKAESTKKAESIAKAESTKKAESIAKAESSKKAESVAKAESSKKAESVAKAESSKKAELKIEKYPKTSVTEVTSIQKYNNSLVLVMQPDKKYGIGQDLAGSKRTQKYILLQARKAMLDFKDNEAAKSGGIVVVSYVKDDDGEYETVMTLYASPSDLDDMSEVSGSAVNFLKREITGYYINGLYLHALMNDNKGIFEGMSLVSQDGEPEWVPEDVSTNMHSFINN